MTSGSRSLLSAVSLGFAMLVVACKPTYPKCDKDENCKAGEVCVNGTCQECRDDASCVQKHGQGFSCVDGRCEQKSECSADGDCAKVGEGLVCRGNRCVPECAQNADCPSGKRCENKRCVAECAQDVDCGPNRFCVDGACSDQPAGATRVSAQCRPVSAQPGEILALEKVHFEFDKFDLNSDARQALDKDASCLKELPQVKVVLEGHCDERGTQEYNLALGEKRAATVQSYLKNQGIDASRLVTRSKGENQPVCEDHTDECWAKNRRVELLQSMR